MTLMHNYMHAVFLILCAVGTQAKTSLSFNLPAIGPFGGFGRGHQGRQSVKNYSGKRVQEDSIRMVYIHDQTVAIVEIQPDKLLLNCELIEIVEPEDIMTSLGELMDTSRPIHITLQEMLKLMSQCEELHEQMDSTEKLNESTQSDMRGLFANNPLTLLSGIIPGTKWCGTGDIAKDYYDLGSEPTVDKCCRAHDLCPVKVRAFSKRYNLTNQSIYTKSHCNCDDALFNCLKSQTSPTAHIMGNIYFNLVQVPCLEDSPAGRQFRSAYRF